MTQSDASSLLSTAARAPAIISMMGYAATRPLARTHLIVGCASNSCTRQPVDEAIAAGSLQCQLGFIAGSRSNVRCHDLRFQRLVKLCGVL
jgi:hypothetical protein